MSSVIPILTSENKERIISRTAQSFIGTFLRKTLKDKDTFSVSQEFNKVIRFSSFMPSLYGTWSLGYGECMIDKGLGFVEQQAQLTLLFTLATGLRLLYDLSRALLQE